jgi:hypothetical protein
VNLGVRYVLEGSVRKSGNPRGSLAATSDQSLLLQRLKTQASVIDGIGILPALQLSDA